MHQRLAVAAGYGLADEQHQQRAQPLPARLDRCRRVGGEGAVPGARDLGQALLDAIEAVADRGAGAVEDRLDVTRRGTRPRRHVPPAAAVSGTVPAWMAMMPPAVIR